MDGDLTRRIDFSPPELQERNDGFSYDYRMRCGCGGAVGLTAETYYRERTVEALAPCEHCDGEVHFGPAVALLRDENDLALGDVTRFAWYHTSTSADWPSTNFGAAADAAARRTAEHLGLDAEYMVEKATTKALHVGTYEAAIENVFRRMQDQTDASSQFFLYRVAIQVEPSRINDGYRDENVEEAAQLTTRDLDQDDLDAIRYLNVHEATGSLSLAVRQECILAAQCIPIPVDGLVLRPSSDLRARLLEIEGQIEELAQERAQLPKLDRLQLTRMRIGKVADPEGIAERAQEVELRGYALWNDLGDVLADSYLGEISPVVADDFCSAVSAWRREGDVGVGAFAEQFANLASLLARSSEVVQLIAQKPWRALNSVPDET